MKPPTLRELFGGTVKEYAAAGLAVVIVLIAITLIEELLG